MEIQRSVRKPTRLPAFDYSQCGGYFITICTDKKRKTLCNIENSDILFQPAVKLTPLGEIVREVLEEQRFFGITLEKYIIMPNHVHLLLLIPGETAKQTISDFVGQLKSVVANRWLRGCKSQGRQMGPIWQRSFNDHIIRNHADLCRIWLYIEGNPSRWREDCLYW